MATSSGIGPQRAMDVACLANRGVMRDNWASPVAEGILNTGESNPYCKALGIAVPRMEHVKDHREARTYSLLIVALLERGQPITLEEAAERMEEAGVAPKARALASLKRCKPARVPIYRDRDLYALDPHDDEADFWVFRLGLRPPAVPSLQIVRPDPGPLPAPDTALNISNLDEAWREDVPASWSAQRTAICVLDAHGKAMQPQSVVAFVQARSHWSRLSVDSPKYWRAGAPIRVRDGGLWELNTKHKAVRSARAAVRDRVAAIRRMASYRTDPAVIEAYRKRAETRRLEHARELASMRRILVHGFPLDEPVAFVLLDINRHEIRTLMGEEVSRAAERLQGYDYIAGLEVRTLLRNLGFDHGNRRLGELGPPQKSMQLNKRGRTLKITTSLLIQGTCGISRPLGDAKVMRGYLCKSEFTKARRRLEADAKSLYALYQFGKLHGSIRLRWGFIDTLLPAPWVHIDEPKFHDLKKRACAKGARLEVVTGSTPGWDEPWSRMQTAQVIADRDSWQLPLVGEDGLFIDDLDVKLARLPKGGDS